MKASGYFYFDSGEATNWLDKTVHTPTVGSRTLEQWLEEFDRLEKVNRDLLKTATPRASKKKKEAGRRADPPGREPAKPLIRSK